MDPLPDGWCYVPHGSPEPVQAYAALVGGPDDGCEIYIGTCKELPGYISRHTREAVHYYALASRNGRWVFLHHSVEPRRK